MASVLDFKNATYEISGNKILSRLNLSIGRNEIVALLGNNGAGKSTFLRLAAGLLKPAQGDVLLFQKNLGMYSHAARKSHITWCANVPPNTLGFTALQFVALTLQTQLFAHGRFALSENQVRKCASALALFDAEKLAHRAIDTLSSGEWQRVQLARAWMSSADLLLLDEPSNALDIRHVSTLIDRVREFVSKNNSAVVFSSHDFYFVKCLATRVVIIHNGKVLESDNPKCIKPALLREVFGVSFSEDLLPEQV